ncbi:hypothetical protein ACLK2E_08970 [Escherichia coli]
MASVKTTLTNNDASKALLTSLKAKRRSPLIPVSLIAATTHPLLCSIRLITRKAIEKVAFSGGQFQLDADREGKTLSLSGEAGSGQINAVNRVTTRKFSSPLIT